MPKRSIAFTMYPVTDLARSKAFYGDALGLPPGELQTDFWAEFDVDGGTFGIGTFEQCGTPGSAQSLALEIPGLDEFCATLKAAGHAPAEPYDLPACRISSVTDPDGNRVFLHERKPR